MRGTRGKAHNYKAACMCRACRRFRHHLFTQDASRVSGRLLAKGGRTITGSLTDDRGTHGKTIPAAFVPTYDPSTHDSFVGLDPEGNERQPLPAFVDKSITATQNLQANPLFTQGNSLIDCMPVVVQTVKDGQEVNIAHKVRVRRGIRPIKSLLGPRPTFAEMDGVKRQTSRSKEVIRDRFEQIAPEVTRLSWNRPDHLVTQAQLEGDIMDLELGLPTQAELDHPDQS